MENRYQFVIGFLTILNAVVLVLLAGLVRDTRHDVNALRGVLASKQDLVNIAAPKLTLFHEEKCTTCHTERRFAGPHDGGGQMERIVVQMSKLPDARISKKEMDKIHASLELLRCSQCHGADQLRQLAIKSPSDRMRIVREMVAKPGSRLTPDEVTRVLRAYEQMIGF
jgi:hypothetical protein